MALTKRGNLIWGVAICTMGYFFAALVGASSKFASSSVPVPVIIFFQNLICLLLNLPRIHAQGYSSLKTKRLGLHLVRDATGIAGFICLFTALTSIPLANAMLLSYTAPLWIPLIALVWPRVRMRGTIWWGILVGLLGIILILQPTKEGSHLGSLLALLSGVIAGITLIAIRHLSTTEPTHRTLFYDAAFSILVTAPFFFYYFHTISTADLPYLAAVGIFTYLAQFFLTYSFQHGNLAALGYFAYTVVLFSGVMDWIFWQNVPNFVSFIGMALVVLGGIFSIYSEKKYQDQL